MPSFFNSFCHFQQIVERNNGCHEYSFCLFVPKLKKNKKKTKNIKRGFKFFWISHNPGGTLAIMNMETQMQLQCSHQWKAKAKIYPFG